MGGEDPFEKLKRVIVAKQGWDWGGGRVEGTGGELGGLGGWELLRRET